MNLKYGILVWICGALLATQSGCSTTSLTDSWQAPTFHRGEMDNVLVVAMTANPTYRILFEEGFVKALRGKGIQATASHSAIGASMPTREAVTAYVENNDIRYVFVTDYSGTQVSKWVVPESVRTYYTGPYFPSYYGYWDAYGSTRTMVRESYVDERKTVMLATSVFEVESGDLVWVGRSKSFNVDSIANDASDLARQVVGSIGR